MVTGVEATGIVLAVIPLTLQCYTAVREIASQYSGYNRTLCRILADIETYEGLFKEALDQLLVRAGVAEEDRRNNILAGLDVGGQYWYNHDLEGKFRSLLGRLFLPVINSIRGVCEALKNIKKILLKLNDEGIPRFKRLINSVANAASLVIGNPFEPRVRDTQIHSTRAKVMSIIRDTQGKLKSLRDDLKSHNESVIHALQLQQSNSTPKLRRPSPATANMANGLPKECLNAKAMQLASRKLYGLTRKALFCDCHQFHLRLGYYGNKPPLVKSQDKSGVLPPTKLETRFSFQMTAKPVSSSEQGRSGNPQPEFHLVFTGCDFNSIDCAAGEHPLGPVPTICEEILASREGYKRYFHGQDGSNSSFVLQQHTAPKTNHKATGSISLSHLVTSRPKELSPFDQLLIAANLASSLVIFYSTPWLQNWSLQKVYFFEKQERFTSTPGLWTPHLYLPFDNRDQSQFRKNGELYSLGLVLLGLGRKELLDYSEEGVDSVLERALRDVCMRMGSDYQRFARRCLYEWSDQNLDFMEEKILESFLSEINVLQVRSRDFNPMVSTG